MSKQVRNVLLLIFLIVIPFLVYAFLQVLALQEDEKMADAMYERQVETVSFSVNQYADDMMAQWVRRLEDEDDPLYENAFDLVLGNESIQLLVLREIDAQNDSLFLNDYIVPDNDIALAIKDWYAQEDSLISQLNTYFAAGFQKIHAVNNWAPIEGMRPDQISITLMVMGTDSIRYNALFILEANYWIEHMLGAKMQEIAQNELNLAVLKYSNPQNNLSITYKTALFNDNKKYVQKELWILSNFFLAVQTKGVNFAELIKKRSLNNLYILFFSIATLLIGAIIMVRSIRNTLKITQLKSDFVANVSHEIRTPLSLIRMYAETLMLGRLPNEEKKQHYYKVIHHESGRLTHLVNNILDFSKIEANRKTYNMLEKDMNLLTQKIYNDFSYSFEEKNVHCKLELSKNPVLIHVDEQAFEEAPSNLIENAIKYSIDTIDILLSTSVDHTCAYLKITDKGKGIDKSEQTHIFDDFYRVEDALTQKTKGTGLGLSLVRHIMKSHNGTISVFSEPNKGSTFTLQFPLINPTS